MWKWERSRKKCYGGRARAKQHNSKMVKASKVWSWQPGFKSPLHYLLPLCGDNNNVPPKGGHEDWKQNAHGRLALHPVLRKHAIRGGYSITADTLLKRWHRRVPSLPGCRHLLLSSQFPFPFPWAPLICCPQSSVWVRFALSLLGEPVAQAWSETHSEMGMWPKPCGTNGIKLQDFIWSLLVMRSSLPMCICRMES